MSKNVVISIPVHQEPTVVRDHLHNIKKFVPNSKVVLHASASSGNNFINQIMSLENNEFKDFVFVNKKSLPTFAEHEAAQVTNLSSVHSSNFQYIYDITQDFDYFILETSNDMFVRRGVETLFENFNSGCVVGQYDIDEFYKFGHPNCLFYLDMLKKIINIKTAEKCSQEGAFYPKDVFKEVASIVLNKLGENMAGEEIILHTLAFNLFPELYKTNVNSIYVNHNADHNEITIQDILAIRDGSNVYQYAVKRVPRNMNSACRRYINDLTKND